MGYELLSEIQDTWETNSDRPLFAVRGLQVCSGRSLPGLWQFHVWFFVFVWTSVCHQWVHRCSSCDWVNVNWCRGDTIECFNFPLLLQIIADCVFQTVLRKNANNPISLIFPNLHQTPMHASLSRAEIPLSFWSLKMRSMLSYRHLKRTLKKNCLLLSRPGIPASNRNSDTHCWSKPLGLWSTRKK